MKAILGAFRTTATASLEVETSLEPAYLRIRSKVLRTYTRMQTAPPTNPISATVKRAKSSTSNVHITALEYLARTFPQHSQGIEIIKPFPVLLGGSQHIALTSRRTRRLQSTSIKKTYMKNQKIYSLSTPMDQESKAR